MKKIIMAFTDASSYNNGKRNPKEIEASASAGFLSYRNSFISRIAEYSPNTSISYGEIYAIYLILKEYDKLFNKHKDDYVLILHSDSAYCVQAITKWVFEWKKAARNGKWIKSDGKEVAYQKLFKKIFDIVYNKGYHIFIKHISGHIDISNSKHICKSIERYKRFNSEEITIEELKYFTFCNDLCDRYAKHILDLGLKGRV